MNPIPLHPVSSEVHKVIDSGVKLKIVIVEDDHFQLKLLSEKFSMLGYKDITAFDDGPTALAHMTHTNSDSTVVVLNLEKIVRGKANLLQKLKIVSFTGAVILTSGTGERRVQSTAARSSPFGLSVAGHLKRPVQLQKLERILNDFSTQIRLAISGGRQHRYSAERLSQAIEAGELCNVYQPKILLRTGELVGVEALVRWQHPDDGLVLPGQFLDLAEENDLIDDIARQVLRNALEDNNHWKDLGREITIAVNISMYNLNTREFVSYLENELSISGVKPQNLTLEITESKIVPDYPLVLDVLTRLRLRRVNLSIDHFGKGSYSMAQLRDIPFNELKIDRGFIHAAHDNPEHQDVVDLSMQLAKDLGIASVAEGVEDEVDWNYMGNSGCDLAQGFFIGKPMKASELGEWQTEWSARYQDLSG